MNQKTYSMGIPGRILCNTLVHANQTRDWRIYADSAQVLIRKDRQLDDGRQSADVDQIFFYSLFARTRLRYWHMMELRGWRDLRGVRGCIVKGKF